MPQQSGTISVAQGSDPRLGGEVSFDTTVSHLPGSADPRIEVRAYQDVPFDYTDSNGETHTQTDSLVFSAAAPASESFLLGGAGSVWLFHGGSAECEATLYYWDNHPEQRQVVLASVTFSAGG